MNIFKQAYKTVRKNSNEIYGGFGFKHLSDVTQYYVHPNNLSKNGRTSLAQSIGEAIILFSTLIKNYDENQPGIDIQRNPVTNEIFLNIKVPDDYHEEKIVAGVINRYLVLLGNNQIKVGVYTSDKKFIKNFSDDLSSFYRLLPIFSTILADDILKNEDIRKLFADFLENNYVDTFVNLHEDFYQNHKFDEYDIRYSDIQRIKLNDFESIIENFIPGKKTGDKPVEIKEVITFPENTFSLEQKELIPKLPEEFILPENLTNIASAIAAGDITTILFHGPSGTGKTMNCKLIAELIKIPIMETINCTENLDEFVLGKFIPEEDKIIFKESFVTKAIRDGGAVVFEEINMAKPQHLAFLNSLLDENGFVRLDNGEMVKRNPNFRFFATMNMGYFGTKELNQALYNRFNCVVEIDHLSDEAIKRMLTTRVPECSDKVDKILSVFHKIVQKNKVEALDLVISPRNLENWARLAQYEGYLKAAESTIIPIARTDRILEESLRSILRIYKWD